MLTAMELIVPFPKYDDQTSASCISWKYLKQRFNDYCQTESKKGSRISLKNNFSNSLLIHLCGEDGQRMVKGFSKRDVDRFHGFLKTIEDYCLPRFILLYERFKFFTCKQNDKNIRQFILEVKHLARYCEFQDHMDRYIQRRILNGVNDEDLRTKLQSKKNIQLNEMLDICFGIELTRDSLKSLGGKNQVTNEKLDDLLRDLKNELCDFTSNYDPSVIKRRNLDKSTNNTSNKKSRKTRNNQRFGYVGFSYLKHHDLSLNSVPKNVRRVKPRAKFEQVIKSHDKNVRRVKPRAKFEQVIKSHDKNVTSAVNESSATNNLKVESKDSILESVNVVLEGVNHRELNGEDKQATLGFIQEDTMNQVHGCHVNKSCEIDDLNKHSQPDGRTLDFFDEEVAIDDNIASDDGQDVGSVSQKTDSGPMKPLKKCQICGFSCTTAHVMKCHMSSHSGQRLYKCDSCNMSFIHSGSRSRHMRLRHPELLKFKCEECGMLFELQTAMDQHKLSHSKHAETTCDDCGATFKTTREHFQHRRKEHRNTRYSCDKCGLHFPYPSKLKLHLMSKHNATKPFMCEICGSAFAEHNMLTNHKNIHSGERNHECVTCGRKFLLKTTLKNHIQTHLDRKPYHCDVCGMSFKLSYYLKSHLKVHEERRERPHICSTCGAAFLKSGQLKNHERKHTGEKPFKCQECDAVFSQLSSMKKHIKRIHEGVKPKDKFSCEYCGQSFTHSCKLKLHLMKHTGERPFTCKTCNATYREKHQLTSHMKVHTGDEPFKCHICGRRFLQKSYMDGHMRNHSGEKPFKCNVCDAGFAQKGYLRDHLKVHDQNRERKYKCSICIKAFTCSSHLRSHEKLHTGEKPHGCERCGSRFTKRSSLKNHLKRTHSLLNPLTCLGQSPVIQTLEEATHTSIPQLPCRGQAELQCQSYLQATSQQPIQTGAIANTSAADHVCQEIHLSTDFYRGQPIVQVGDGMKIDAVADIQSHLHQTTSAMQPLQHAPVPQVPSIHLTLTEMQPPAQGVTIMHTNLHTATQQSSMEVGLQIYTVPSQD